MTHRKHTPLHDFWHRRVEGQIRDAIHSHPEWFNIRSDTQKRTLVNSLAKRIVGEIVAACTVAAERAEVADICPSTRDTDGGRLLPSDGGGGGASCTPSDTQESAETRFRHRFEADRADELSEEAWCDWVNKLPRDEFFAMLELGISDSPS